MFARVCPVSNKQGESINFRPVHSIMISNTTNEDYSGNYHKLLEFQVVSLYSNSVPQPFPAVTVFSARRAMEGGAKTISPIGRSLFCRKIT